MSTPEAECNCEQAVDLKKRIAKLEEMVNADVTAAQAIGESWNRQHQKLVKDRDEWMEAARRFGMDIDKKQREKAKLKAVMRDLITLAGDRIGGEYLKKVESLLK